MIAEVNLFEKKIQKIRRSLKLKFLAIRLLMGLVLVLALVLIGVSSYSLVVAKANQKLETKIETTKKQISNLSEIESKQVYLLSKLGSFEPLIQTQETSQAVVETIFELLPDGTSLKGFEVAEDGVISLTGSVPDFTIFNELLYRIKQTNNYRLPIIRAVADQVSLGADGSVNFSINITININKTNS